MGGMASKAPLCLKTPSKKRISVHSHTDLVKVDEFVKEQGSKKEGLQVGEVSVGTVGCDSAPKATEVEVSVGTVGLSEAASNIDTASKFLVAGNVGCNVTVEEQQVAVNNKGSVVDSNAEELYSIHNSLEDGLKDEVTSPKRKRSSSCSEAPFLAWLTKLSVVDSGVCSSS
ncbi:hypothetical protein ACOSQ4_006665 [Xanthoceras sorbifolium]